LGDCRCQALTQSLPSFRPMATNPTRFNVYLPYLMAPRFALTGTTSEIMIYVAMIYIMVSRTEAKTLFDTLCDEPRPLPFGVNSCVVVLEKLS
jgi:hypothetical protein